MCVAYEYLSVKACHFVVSVHTTDRKDWQLARSRRVIVTAYPAPKQATDFNVTF